MLWVRWMLGWIFVVSEVLSASWSHTSRQWREFQQPFQQPFQVLPGSTGDPAWGDACLSHREPSAHSLLSSSLLISSLLSLPLSELLNSTSGADFYINSSLWGLLMLGCFHSDINMHCKNAKYQKSVTAAGLWQPQESRDEDMAMLEGHSSGRQGPRFDRISFPRHLFTISWHVFKHVYFSTLKNYLFLK